MEPRKTDNRGKVNIEGQKALGKISGSVAADGTLSNAPTGVSSVAPTSSVYTITHNLGLTANSYKVQLSVTGASSGAAIVTTKGTNSFTVSTFDLATPTAANRAFDFELTVGDGE